MSGHTMELKLIAGTQPAGACGEGGSLAATSGVRGGSLYSTSAFHASSSAAGSHTGTVSYSLFRMKAWSLRWVKMRSATTLGPALTSRPGTLYLRCSRWNHGAFQPPWPTSSPLKYMVSAPLISLMLIVKSLPAASGGSVTVLRIHAAPPSGMPMAFHALNVLVLIVFQPLSSNVGEAQPSVKPLLPGSARPLA